MNEAFKLKALVRMRPQPLSFICLQAIAVLHNPPGCAEF